jgi:hypothetical protein
VTAATTTNQPLAASHPAGWVSSPAWDLFWMFSAVWGAALFFGGSLLAETAALAALFFAGNRILSSYHAWSTTYMVMASPLLEEERLRQPRKYLYTPLSIAALAFALGMTVAYAQRFPENGRFDASLWPFALYIGVFWVGHFWHFGRQDFGVLSIYRGRAGQTRALDRRVDQWLTMAMMYVIQPIVYLDAVRTTAFAEIVHTLIPVAPDVLRVSADVAIACASVLCAGVLGFELVKPNRSIPKLLYTVVIWSHPVLLYFAVRNGQQVLGGVYMIAYLWSHWLIAIGLVAHINVGYLRQQRGYGMAGAVLRHVLTLGAIVAVVVLLMISESRYVLFDTANFEYKQLLATIPDAERSLIGFVMGLFLAEQLVHYYCDRCLFRMREPGIRKTVGALL